jgi:hypothetical protein
MADPAMQRRSSFYLGVVAAVVLLTSCGGGSEDESSSPEDVGQFSTTSADGRLAVSVNGSEFDGSLEAKGTEARLTFERDAIEGFILGAYQLGPDGSEFDEPATVTFTLPSDYPDTAFAVISRSVTHGDEVVEDIEIVTSSSETTITAHLRHFSTIVILGFDIDFSVDPGFWEMAVGETWLPEVVFNSGMGPLPAAGIPGWEFQAVRSEGSISTVADEQVKCDELGEGQATVLAVLTLEGALIDEAGRPLSVPLIENIDVAATVDCIGFSDPPPDDDNTQHGPGEPTVFELADQKCLTPGGSVSSGCHVIVAGYEFPFIRLALPSLEERYVSGEQPDFDSYSIYFLTRENEFGVACDGLDMDTFAPAPPGTEVPCRVSLLGGNATGPLLDMVDLPSGSFEGEEFTLDVDHPLFASQDGVAGLLIPEGTLDLDANAVPTGFFHLDTITGTMQPAGSDYSIGQIDVGDFNEAVFGGD